MDGFGTTATKESTISRSPRFREDPSTQLREREEETTARDGH
jgi:hypothetical protein